MVHAKSDESNSTMQQPPQYFISNSWNGHLAMKWETCVEKISQIIIYAIHKKMFVNKIVV